MARPKKQRKLDPLAHVHEGIAAAQLPAPVAPRNAPSAAAEMLASGVRRLQQLDRQIGTLNASKSEIYRQLKDDGYDKPTVQRALKELRIDPLERARRQRIYEIYWAELNAALDAADSGGDVDEAEA